jgi:hypothetical protein
LTAVLTSCGIAVEVIFLATHAWCQELCQQEKADKIISDLKTEVLCPVTADTAIPCHIMSLEKGFSLPTKRRSIIKEMR